MWHINAGLQISCFSGPNDLRQHYVFPWPISIMDLNLVKCVRPYKTHYFHDSLTKFPNTKRQFSNLRDILRPAWDNKYPAYLTSYFSRDCVRSVIHHRIYRFITLLSEPYLSTGAIFLNLAAKNYMPQNDHWKAAAECHDTPSASSFAGQWPKDTIVSLVYIIWIKVQFELCFRIFKTIIHTKNQSKLLGYLSVFNSSNASINSLRKCNSISVPKPLLTPYFWGTISAE